MLAEAIAPTASTPRSPRLGRAEPSQTLGCDVVSHDRIEVRRTIAADPTAVWSAVTDITRMGEWSPECHTAL
jgi:hypothetical protein